MTSYERRRTNWKKRGVVISGMSDHTVSQSLYLSDPDGNEVELYVDSSAIDWRQNPERGVIPDQTTSYMNESEEKKWKPHPNHQVHRHYSSFRR